MFEQKCYEVVKFKSIKNVTNICDRAYSFPKKFFVDLNFFDFFSLAYHLFPGPMPIYDARHR